MLMWYHNIRSIKEGNLTVIFSSQTKQINKERARGLWLIPWCCGSLSASSPFIWGRLIKSYFSWSVFSALQVQCSLTVSGREKNPDTDTQYSSTGRVQKTENFHGWFYPPSLCFFCLSSCLFELSLHFISLVGYVLFASLIHNFYFACSFISVASSVILHSDCHLCANFG